MLTSVEMRRISASRSVRTIAVEVASARTLRSVEFTIDPSRLLAPGMLFTV
jgi:hypothetical protein